MTAKEAGQSGDERVQRRRKLERGWSGLFIWIPRATGPAELCRMRRPGASPVAWEGAGTLSMHSKHHFTPSSDIETKIDKLANGSPCSPPTLLGKDELKKIPISSASHVLGLGDSPCAKKLFSKPVAAIVFMRVNVLPSPKPGRYWKVFREKKKSCWVARCLRLGLRPQIVSIIGGMLRFNPTVDTHGHLDPRSQRLSICTWHLSRAAVGWNWQNVWTGIGMCGCTRQARGQGGRLCQTSQR